jgi:hypothetical protein
VRRGSSWAYAEGYYIDFVHEQRGKRARDYPERGSTDPLLVHTHSFPVVKVPGLWFQMVSILIRTSLL